MIIDLSAVGRSSSRRNIGAKAYHLGCMLSVGLPVPEGYVISSEMLNGFIEANCLNERIGPVLATMDKESVESVTRSSSIIRTLFSQATFPAFMRKQIEVAHRPYLDDLVAVRSSGLGEDQRHRSAAGHFESFLNVSSGELLTAIVDCWSSLFSTIALWHLGAPPMPYACAVIVQRMVPALRSGVAFSSHPTLPDTLLIEGAPGTGDAFMSGRARITSILIERRKRRDGHLTISSSDPKAMQHAPEEWPNWLIEQLTDYTLQAEAIFGYPVDVEWAASSDRTYLVQCRPIVPQPHSPVDLSTAAQLSEFELLWHTTYPRFFASLYLDAGYRRSGFIACQKGRQHTLFISKNLRTVLSNAAFSCYTDGYDDYLHRVRLTLKAFDDMARTASTPAQMTLLELAERLAACVKHSLDLWRVYFVTESHSTEGWSQVERSLIRPRVLRRMMLLKFMQRRRLDQIPELATPLLEEIALRLGGNCPAYLIDCDWHDVSDALAHGALPRRPEHELCEVAIGTTHVTGAKAARLISRLMRPDYRSTVLRGRSASSGRYAGLAEVIHGLHGSELLRRIDSMAPGSVLVTGSTGPELMLACRKAGAIVTDEGGIISHAALVARELGIPTVIGTRTATQRIRTGDWLEVNASEGTVGVSAPIDS
ncbi:PEP/pyruvate-binding domain-containing protein [Burkholderia sp. TSV86]|uniref:PEP/pyruvate-binding domain-containing protein n=1 Tax=Burkholderia sp. TSV86 TaxID=1385594 RepID=UPI0009E7749A|nr:PEP/pyruvate-binding domain-containing protein [Burkholderia sp. TSV86]